MESTLGEKKNYVTPAPDNSYTLVRFVGYFRFSENLLYIIVKINSSFHLYATKFAILSGRDCGFVAPHAFRTKLCPPYQKPHSYTTKFPEVKTLFALYTLSLLHQLAT